MPQDIFSKLYRLVEQHERGYRKENWNATASFVALEDEFPDADRVRIQVWAALLKFDQHKEAHPDVEHQLHRSEIKRVSSLYIETTYTCSCGLP